ncbi:YqjF family protein [Anatilimnocola floriformis]|uniref:YqjF family protein n=1 Tax=Anatilimnocola floriformis TaxID=2948575 RepID=UPI0020C52D44|nr:DUF2071 domain-containing protein [Anatilimnocola floriformis]
MQTQGRAQTDVTILPVKPRRQVFLSARWQALAMVNFAVDPQLLQSLVPRGTELDFFDGVTYVSVVGFLFRDTRLLGLPVPGHIDFEEVNLRFYVRRTVGNEVRRGVCFIRELVPRWAIATVARWSYNEPYLALPMRNQVRLNEITAAPPSDQSHSVAYSWKSAGWHGFQIATQGSPAPLQTGSLAEFIAEHYWGYCRQRDGGTVEYEVEHPRWNAWQATLTSWEGDVPGFYGEPWSSALAQPPSSVFLADGSAVKVFKPTRIA